MVRCATQVLTGIVFVAGIAAATLRVCAVAHPRSQAAGSVSAPASPLQAQQTGAEPTKRDDTPTPVPKRDDSQPASTNKSDSAQASANAPAVRLPPLRERAWNVLRDGLGDKSPEKRAKAVHALGLLNGTAAAEKAAKEALKDEKGNVRAAAAGALGSMHAVHAVPELEVALDDEEPEVVLAAANSLLQLKNTSSAYRVYYSVLTGDRRTDKGFVKENLKILQNRKKLIQMGVEQGIGFIPFAGFGYDAYKTVVKSDGSPVRAAAAKKLAHDPSAEASRALLRATHDKSWMVRAAALEAISERGDKSLRDKLFLSLDDEKEDVRFIAAACIAHLSDLPAKLRPSVTAKLSE
jgi:HEAT repeat protein